MAFVVVMIVFCFGVCRCDICQDLVHGVTCPTFSSTYGGFGQPPFSKDCKPDHLEPSGYSDTSHLIFEKNLASRGSENRRIWRVFVCPTCVPLWKLTTNRVKKVKRISVFLCFPISGFGEDVPKKFNSL